MTPEEARELERILREGIDPERARQNIQRRQELEAQGKGREDYRFQVHTIPPDFFEDAARIQANIEAGVYGSANLQPVDQEAVSDTAPTNSVSSKGAPASLARFSSRTRVGGGSLERVMAKGSRWLAKMSSRAVMMAVTVVFSFAAMCAAIALMIHYYPEKIGAGYFMPPGTQQSPRSQAQEVPGAPSASETPARPSTSAIATATASMPSSPSNRPSKGSRGLVGKPSPPAGKSSAETIKESSQGDAALWKVY